MSRYLGGYERVVDNAADIYRAFEDTSIYKVVVMPGTYSFTGITNDLVLHSNKHIEFVGEVVFQNVRIITETLDDGNYYDSGSSSTVAWNGGTSSFDKTGGGNWAATTDWSIFVRDTWYGIQTAAATAINPTIDFHGSALALEYYVLCLPTTNLTVVGNLTLIMHNTPGPETTSVPSYIKLTGLKDCNLSNWKINLTRDSDTALTYSAAGWLVPFCAHYCAQVTLPEVAVNQINYVPGGASGLYCVGLHNLFHCISNSLIAGNILMNTALAGDLWGIYHWASKGNFLKCVASGLRRAGGGAGDDVIGIGLGSTTESCRVIGTSIAPDSSAGASNYYVDDGVNNTVDVVTEAA